MAKVWWVVVAAGSSTRMGAQGSKMWAEVAGQSVMAFVLTAIARSESFERGVVVVRPSDVEPTNCLLAALAAQGTWLVELGGQSRAESVRCGLEAILQEGAMADDLVLIHDGARPLVSPDLVARVIRTALRDGAAIPLISLADTVKQVNAEEHRVVGTIDREHLGLAQTPQGFRLGAILEAHRTLSPSARVTDDAEVMEKNHHRVSYVMGEPTNRKITTPDDLVWFRWWVSLDSERSRTGG